MKIFTRKISLLLAFMCIATLGMAQTNYNTVGIIGSATALGWNSSTAMTRVAANGHDWTITLPLTAAAGTNEVKFRANDDWAVNWGATTFPAGTGTQGGTNIPVTSANRYTVRFNDITGVYQFSVVTATKSSNDALLNLALAPNPAQETVSVAYQLPIAATATISVKNLLGQSVRQLTAVRQSAGAQDQPLSLVGLAPGVYLVQLQTGSLTQTSRLLVE